MVTVDDGLMKYQWTLNNDGTYTRKFVDKTGVPAAVGDIYVPT